MRAFRNHHSSQRRIKTQADNNNKEEKSILKMITQTEIIKSNNSRQEIMLGNKEYDWQDLAKEEWK